MRLRHIEVFHAIYSTGSITNAAELLHVSQPSVSKVLHHAELQLGFELFHRVKGKLVPTTEAKALIDEVNKVYQQINSLKKVARNLRENVRGHVSIAVMPALGLNVVPMAIKAFHASYPEVTFEVQTKHYDQVIESLFEYENDIGLVFNPPSQAGLSEALIGSAEMVCVYPPETFPQEQERLHLADLKGREFISIVDSGPLGDILKFELGKQEGFYDSLIQVQTYYIAKNLVGYGLGVAVVDEFTAKSEGPGDVEYKRLSPPLEFCVKGLFLENKPLSKVCRSFLDCLQAVYQEVAATDRVPVYHEPLM